jgi:hypothetical protein
MTTTAAAAIIYAWNTSFRRFVADECGAGFVENVDRQGNEARPDDSQSGPLNLFTPEVVKIVVEPPKQRRP